MNILDENIGEGQRQLLKSWRIAVRQIGHEVGRKGMKDEHVIPFLLRLQRMGCVIRVSSLGLSVWRVHAEKEEHLHWAG